MKNGPPRKLINIPAGSSYGAKIMRAARSQTATNPPPSMAQKGIRRALSFPMILLAI